MLIWAVLSYIFSEILTRVVLACSFFIRWSKSRYHPKNPAQRKRMALVLGLPLGDPEGGAVLQIKPPNVAAIIFAFCETVVQGLLGLVQAMFDVIIIRFAFMSIGAVDLRLSVLDIAVGATVGVQSVFFIGMQSLMLVCTRSLSLIEFDPFKESTGYTCPYPDDYISVMTGRMFLLVMALIIAIITFLCANGHFMGQEYILRDFGKQVDMNLGKLDPDKKLDGGSIIRTQQFFSMIPTTLGIWIDGWNVKGLLLKERAMSMEGRKMTGAQAAKYKAQLSMAMMKDRGVQSNVRYFLMLYFTVMLTDENVAEMALQMFELLTLVAYSKAVCEVLLPALCLAVVGALLVASAVAAKKAAKAAVQPYRISPVIGQVLHGVTPGLGGNMGITAFIGLSVGGALSVLLAMVSYALELCDNCDLAGGLIKVFVAGVESVGAARVFTSRLTTTTFYLAMAMLAVVLVPGTNLAFRKTPANHDGSPGESSLYPLLATCRIMSGPFGVIAGVYAGLLSNDLLTGNLNTELCLLLSVAIAYVVGMAYGLATDKMLERPAGKWSVGAGTLAALSCGLLFHWAIGVAVGSVVGSVTGALIERRVMKEIQEKC
eukprot:g15576.t1